MQRYAGGVFNGLDCHEWWRIAGNTHGKRTMRDKCEKQAFRLVCLAERNNCPF